MLCCVVVLCRVGLVWLGLTPGPVFAQLKAGKVVTAPVWVPESDPTPALAPAPTDPLPPASASASAAAGAALPLTAQKPVPQAPQKQPSKAKAKGAAALPARPPKGSGPMKQVMKQIRPEDVVSPPTPGAVCALLLFAANAPSFWGADVWWGCVCVLHSCLRWWIARRSSMCLHSPPILCSSSTRPTHPLRCRLRLVRFW